MKFVDKAYAEVIELTRNNLDKPSLIEATKMVIRYGGWPDAPNGLTYSEVYALLTRLGLTREDVGLSPIT
jgi:hypothetical protein